MLKYEKLVVGELTTNCYILFDEISMEGVVIDPGDSGVEIAQIVADRKIILKGILTTHGHFDHLLGALDLKLIYNVPLYCHSADMFLLKRQRETANHYLRNKIATPNIAKIDVDLKKIDKIFIGKEIIMVIPCPGHTPGGVSFYCQKAKWLFTGDTIFAEGMIGDINHSYSSESHINKSINKLMQLPPNTIVLPGHGEETTIGSLIPILDSRH